MFSGASSRQELAVGKREREMGRWDGEMVRNGEVDGEIELLKEKEKNRYGTRDEAWRSGGGLEWRKYR